MKVFENSAALAASVGETFGPSSWVEVTQDIINRFAEATGDRQWIHVDVERAAREAPGGRTIAHGYLALSLMGRMLPELYTVNSRTVLNYGSDKLRFLAPVASGSRVRLLAKTLRADPVPGGNRVTSAMTVEVEGGGKPALIVEVIFLYID